jgi:hypothetical protein
MNVSSSVGQTAMFAKLSTSNISANPNAPVKNSVRPVAPFVSDVEQEQSSNRQAAPSIVIDEQAIALYEQSQASLSSQSPSSNERFSSENQDKPSAKNETAVANYQAVGNLAQRESVQKLFGVDLFA